MVTVLKTFKVESRASGATLQLDLVEGMDEAHLESIQRLWAPLLKRQYDLAYLEFFQLPETEQTLDRWHEIVRRDEIPDYHWNWGHILQSAKPPKHALLALLNGEEVEACMRLDHEQVCRNGSGAPLVYIEYVAIAPWNRKAIRNPPRFQGLGRIMIGAAIGKSMQAGYEGRCGLHSVRQAEGFYRRLDMPEHGIDDEAGMVYFEFDADGAQRFLAR